MSGNVRQTPPAYLGARANELYRLSTAYPILLPLVLLVIAAILRVVDIFALGVAELVGEAFIHKALGFVLVVLYLWAMGKNVQAIGLHGRLAGKAMLIGGSGVVIVLTIGFALQWAVLRAAGKQASIVVAAIDSRTGLAGGLFFALILVVGNLVNSFMEEGLFRGVMLRHFRVRLSPWQANFLQAALFGIWHLAWPVKDYLTGQADFGSAAGQAVFIVLGASVTGLFYGYLYLKTDSLWAPWLAHTINNTTLNLLHMRTIGGLDADISVGYMTISVGYLALILWTKVLAQRFQMPEVRPWGVSES
jgi:membrane protease YdiL (CAAX protease family)